MAAIERIPVPVSSSGSTPRIQRKMPAPFQRPSISVGEAPAERRQWGNVMSQDLKAGDIVPGVGRLSEVNEITKMESFNFYEWSVTVKGGADNTKTYPGGELVWAFAAGTRAE